MIKAIDPNQLLMQMRAMQTQATQSPTNMPGQQDNQSGRVDFANLMKGAVDQVNATQQSANSLRTAFELGDPNVNLVDVMISSQKASVAFEATVQVRNKLVQAYEEVMRMPV
ncbi:flagellar hook-basal body complex protein FliE [Methylophaga lonarensis MPL]|uniref:Flagellar hook-basal body complex protein FliE n=1 Tax=Methylophaga lonarensis MPL TaxID=1286106 RepID=M7PK99_9GAMM|nr:flagellar hook-basal body complex protein FliE [Methylophaga lonarensis]EMR14280.1 flagellar hook-basal body complex protein FliE [Methylophaga lonarensis MPL]MCC5796387.1 flagellar hook-basal body complex protein FliE [Methylophaga sp.]